MLTAECGIQGDNPLQRVAAWNVTKADGPFVCPWCASGMTLKQGAIVTPHFAHKPGSDCEYAKGETEEHRGCKRSIYEALRVMGIEVELERVLPAILDPDGVSVPRLRPDLAFDGVSVPRLRPDLAFERKGQSNTLYRVAVEVQVSRLTLLEIEARTRNYRWRGIHLLWCSPWQAGLEYVQYSSSAWERWLHTAYRERVYYWHDAATFIPVHFGPVLNRGGAPWAPDERAVSKRYVHPEPGPRLQFPLDFEPVERPATDGRSVRVPARRVMEGRGERWWV